jgi:hypothetical protein
MISLGIKPTTFQLVAYDTEDHLFPKQSKIWPILKNLKKKFMELYTLQRYQYSLLLCKRRLGFVQYMPLKRARFGVKTYMLCEHVVNHKIL